MLDTGSSTSLQVEKCDRKGKNNLSRKLRKEEGSVKGIRIWKRNGNTCIQHSLIIVPDQETFACLLGGGGGFGVSVGRC